MMTKITVNEKIFDTDDMLVNTSKAVASAMNKKYIDFNDIHDVELYLTIVTKNANTMFKIFASFNKLRRKNVRSFILTKTGYVPFNGGYMREYLEITKQSLNIRIPFKRKAFVSSAIAVKSIATETIHGYDIVYVKEFDSYSGTHMSICNKEDRAAKQAGRAFGSTFVYPMIINFLGKDCEYVRNVLKTFKFNYSINGKIIRNKVLHDPISDDDKLTLEHISYIFGDYPLECGKDLMIELLKNLELILLDKTRYDEERFECALTYLIEKYFTTLKEYYYERAYDLCFKMDVKDYFSNEDEILYKESCPDDDDEEESDFYLD